MKHTETRHDQVFRTENTQVWRESIIERAAFFETPEQELRAFCLDRAISMKSYALLDRDADTVQAVLEAAERLRDYVLNGSSVTA